MPHSLFSKSFKTLPKAKRLCLQLRLHSKRAFRATQKNLGIEENSHFLQSHRVRIDRFGSLLPFGEELSDGIFSIVENESDTLEALGYVLEISPQTGASMELAHHLESLISSDLPSGTGLQVSLFASPDIDWASKAYCYSRTPACVASEELISQAQVLESLATHRARFLQSGTHQDLVTGEPFRIRHFRAWISVTIPVKNHSPDLFVQIQKVKTLRTRHIATLKTFHLYAFTWNANTLRRTLGQLVNPQKFFLGTKNDAFHELDHSCANPHDRLADQVVDRDTQIKILENGIRFDSNLKNGESVCAIGLSVQGYPSDYALPLVQTWLGSDKENFPCPFVFTTAIHFPDYEKTKSHANLMAARSKQIAASEVAHYLPSLRKRAQDYEVVTEEYAKNGALVQVVHQALLFAPTGSEPQAIEAMRSVMKSAHLEVTEDRCMHLQAFLASLPMTLTTTFASDIKLARRFTTKTLTSLCHMVPILAEFTGSGARDNEESLTPLLLLNGRHGQITPIDPFANSGNFNAIIVGSSGSGKSALTNDLITGNLGTGGKTYVIDVGGSYRKLSHLLGGQWIEYTKDQYLVINPFELVRDISDDMGYLMPILVEMVSPNENLCDYSYSVLRDHAAYILRQAHEEKRLAQIDDLVESLQRSIRNPLIENTETNEPDQRILDLATQLSAFASNGLYGHYFTGHSTVNFTSNFMVLELEGLKSRKNLQSVVLLCLIFLIYQELNNGDLTQPKMVVIDEAWDLLSHKHAEKFIETGYRRARKQNASFITITQSFADYYQNDTALAALANADLRFILRQKPDSIDFLEKEKKISLTPWEIRAIKSLRLKEEAYAECLFMSPDTPSAVLQIRFDAFSRLLYSTKASDMARIQTLMQKGFSLHDAILEIIRSQQKA